MGRKKRGGFSAAEHQLGGFSRGSITDRGGGSGPLLGSATISYVVESADIVVDDFCWCMLLRILVSVFVVLLFFVFPFGSMCNHPCCSLFQGVRAFLNKFIEKKKNRKKK